MEQIIAKLAIYDISELNTLFRSLLKLLKRTKSSFTIIIGLFVIAVIWSYFRKRTGQVNETNKSSEIEKPDISDLKLLIRKWRQSYPNFKNCILRKLQEIIKSSVSTNAVSYATEIISLKIDEDNFREKNLNDPLDINEENLQLTHDLELSSVQVSGILHKDTKIPFTIILQKVQSSILVNFFHTNEVLNSVNTIFLKEPNFKIVNSNLPANETSIIITKLIKSIRGLQLNFDINELFVKKYEDSAPAISHILNSSSTQIDNQIARKTNITNSYKDNENIKFYEEEESLSDKVIGRQKILSYNESVKNEIKSQCVVSSIPRSASDYGEKDSKLNEEQEDDTLLHAKIANEYSADLSKTVYGKNETDLSPFQERISQNLSAKKLLVKVVKAFNINMKSTSSGYCVVELHEPYQRHTTHVVPFNEEIFWDQHLLFTLNTNSKRAHIELFELTKRRKSVSRGRCEVQLGSLLVEAANKSEDTNDLPVNSTSDVVRRLSLVSSDPFSESHASSFQNPQPNSSCVTQGIGQLGPVGHGLQDITQALAGVQAQVSNAQNTSPTTLYANQGINKSTQEININDQKPSILVEFNFMEKFTDEPRRSIAMVGSHKLISKTQSSASGSSVKNFPNVNTSSNLSIEDGGVIRRSNTFKSTIYEMPSRINPSNTVINSKQPISSTNYNNNNGSNLTHSLSLDVVPVESLKYFEKSHGVQKTAESSHKIITGTPKTVHRRSQTTRSPNTGGKSNNRSNYQNSSNGLTSPGVIRKVQQDLNTKSRIRPSYFDEKYLQNSSSTGTSDLSLTCSIEELNVDTSEHNISSVKSNLTQKNMPETVEDNITPNDQIKSESTISKETIEKPFLDQSILDLACDKKRMSDLALDSSSTIPRSEESSSSISSVFHRLKRSKSKLGKNPSENSSIIQGPTGSLALLGPSSQLAGMAAGLSSWSDHNEQSRPIQEAAAMATSKVVSGAIGSEIINSSQTEIPKSPLSSNSSGNINQGGLQSSLIKRPDNDHALSFSTSNIGNPAPFAKLLPTPSTDVPRRQMIGPSNSNFMKLFKGRKKRYRSLGAEKMIYLENVENMDFDAMSNEGYLRILRDDSI